MKNLIVILAISLLVMQYSFAQEVEDGDYSYTKKGRVTIGLESGFSYSHLRVKIPDFGNYTNWLISPTLSGGYFVIDDLLIRGSIVYHYEEETLSGNTNTRSETDLLISARYFKRNFFITAGYGISIDFIAPSDETSYGYVPLDVGYAYFINKNISIQPGFRVDIGAHNSSKSLRIGFDLGLGIYLR